MIIAADLFVCCLSTRDLFVVEVKDWSGSIHLNPDGSWLQTREYGPIVVHPNVVMSSDPWLVFLPMYCRSYVDDYLQTLLVSPSHCFMK